MHRAIVRDKTGTKISSPILLPSTARSGFNTDTKQHSYEKNCANTLKNPSAAC